MSDESYPAGDPLARADSILVAGERSRLVRAGDPSAPAVVLLHGWGASAYSFRKLIPGLAGAGLHVIAPDLRGHGGSDKPRDVEAYSSGAMASRMAALLDALGLTPVVMVGQSIGGAIVLDLATTRPDLVPGAVLLSSIGFTRLRRVEVLRRLAVWRLPSVTPGRWLIEWVMRRIYGEREPWTPRDIDEYWAPLRDPATGAALMALVRSFDFSPRRPEGVAYLGSRLRLIFGDGDRPVPLAAALDHARLFDGARIDVLRGVGHVPAEEAPGEVVTAIREVAEAVALDAPTGRSAGRQT